MKEIMKENVSYNASTSYNNTINIVSERLSFHSSKIVLFPSYCCKLGLFITQ